MPEPAPITLAKGAWDEVSDHAVDAFPEECCGIILHDGKTDIAHRLSNIQNKLHALDPETYPRDATTAYAMDFKELESATRAAEVAGARIKAFYHSHPNHEAYFSDEDKAFACPFGEPLYPESAQIVISVYNRAVKRVAAYAWMEEKQNFVEIPLKVA